MRLILLLSWVGADRDGKIYRRGYKGADNWWVKSGTETNLTKEQIEIIDREEVEYEDSRKT